MGTVKYSGPVASFHCPTNAEIRSLKVHFSPKQKGSGDPSPENVREIVGWDGVEVYQTGKNIWDEEWEGGYLNTTTGANATTTTQIRAKNYIPLLPNTTYTVKALSKGTIWACFFDSDKVIIKDYTITNLNRSANVYAISGKTFTTPNNCAYMRFYFTEAYGKIYNNDVIITVGSTVTLYEPYHSSTTNYEFGVLGKNKLNIGTVSFTGYKKYEIEGGLMPATYTASALITSDDEDSTKSLMLFQNENSTIKQIFLERNIRNAVTFTLTQPATSVYIYSGDSYQRSVGDATTWSEVQLELGSTATAYEPYDPNKTVYGGWVDLISGEVQQEWAHVIIDENTSFYMATRQNNSGNYFYKEFNNKPDKQCLYTAGKLSESMRVEKSNQFEIRNSWGEDSINYFSAWAYANADTKTTIRFGFPSELNIASVDAAKSWFIENGSLEIIYPLVASISYSLAPTEMQTFLSHNNVWSNADYVEVEYDLHETQNILARKQFIIANQPHIVKPAAAPLQNFTTDVAAPLKECKIYFNPVQEGTGDPSPDNVRAISGWTGIEVEQRNKNLLSNYENGYFHTFIPAETKLVASSDIPTSGNNQVRFYRADKTEIDYWTLIETYTDNRRKRSFTPHEDCYYWRFNNNDLNVQLELGSVATDYEPYQGTTLPIDWTDSTGIVYGGYVDLITGELWRTYGTIKVANRTWNNYSQRIRYYINLQDRKDAGNVFTDTLTPNQSGNFTSGNVGEIIYYGNSNNYSGYFFIILPESMEAQDANQWIQETYPDATIYYELKNPVLLTTLTPTQLKTLRGTNNIWSNANGDIELAYWKH